MAAAARISGGGKASASVEMRGCWRIKLMRHAIAVAIENTIMRGQRRMQRWR